MQYLAYLVFNEHPFKARKKKKKKKDNKRHISSNFPLDKL